jgi:hypothetical protein
VEGLLKKLNEAALRRMAWKVSKKTGREELKKQKQRFAVWRGRSPKINSEINSQSE